MLSPPKSLAVVLMGLSIVCALVPLWWWALIGMSDEVASAWFWTNALIAFVAWTVTVWAFDP